MSFLTSFAGNMKGEVLKNMLLKQGIQPHQLEGVDFNSPEQINQLAQTLVPDLFKKNPMIANLIKQNSAMMGDKGKEVVEVIDKL